MSDDALPEDEPDLVVDEPDVDPVDEPAEPPAGKANDVAKIERALAKANKEAEKQRHAARELAEKLQAIEDAKLSETERLQKELDAATKRAEQMEREAAKTMRHSQIVTKAMRLGFADPDDAAILIRSDAEDLDEALADLLEAKPYLKASTPGQPGTGGQPGKSKTSDAPTETDQERRTRIMTGGGITVGQQDRAWAESRGGGVFISQKGLKE